jgi:thymidine phosphorylase
MQAVELIRKKRDGHVLNTAEINWLVDQYTHGQVPDYQMSAWLMAVYQRSDAGNGAFGRGTARARRSFSRGR